MLLLHDGCGGGEHQLCCSFWKLYSERTHQFLYNELIVFFHWGRPGRKDYSTTDTNSHGHSDPVPSVCGQLQWFIWVLLCVCVCANWAFYRNWYTLTVFTCFSRSVRWSQLTNLLIFHPSVRPPTCLYRPVTTSSLFTGHRSVLRPASVISLACPGSTPGASFPWDMPKTPQPGGTQKTSLPAEMGNLISFSSNK